MSSVPTPCIDTRFNMYMCTCTCTCVSAHLAGAWTTGNRPWTTKKKPRITGPALMIDGGPFAGAWDVCMGTCAGTWSHMRTDMCRDMRTDMHMYKKSVQKRV